MVRVSHWVEYAEPRGTFPEAHFWWEPDQTQHKGLQWSCESIGGWTGKSSPRDTAWHGRRMLHKKGDMKQGPSEAQWYFWGTDELAEEGTSLDICGFRHGAIGSSSELQKIPTSQQQSHGLSINKQAVSIWLKGQISDQKYFLSDPGISILFT